jgi:hypothetical protein
MSFERLRQDRHDRDSALENARGRDRYVKAIGIFDFYRPVFVSGINVQHGAIEFIELNAPEKAVEVLGSDDQSHAGSYRLILNHRDLHDSFRAPKPRETRMILPYFRASLVSADVTPGSRSRLTDTAARAMPTLRQPNAALCELDHKTAHSNSSRRGPYRLVVLTKSMASLVAYFALALASM